MNPETVRVDLLEVWPQLTRLYGIRPWEAELLSADEVAVYLEDLRRVQDAEREQSEQVNRQFVDAGRSYGR